MATPGPNSNATNESPGYLRRWTVPRKRLGLTAIGLIVAWAGVSLVLSERGLIDFWELQDQETALRSELDALQARAAQIDYELNEPGGMAVERSAREKFEMQRPGEIVYHFAPVEAESETPPLGSVDNPKSDR